MRHNVELLQLLLDEIGCDASIESIRGRKIIQKTVYLAQLTGVDLGYRFGWYVRGPYCSELADHYYELGKCPADVKLKIRAGLVLDTALKKKLEKIKPLLQSNLDSLDNEYWLEALASYHHLRIVQQKGESEAKEVMEKQKAHLREFLPYGEDALKKLETLNENSEANR